MTSRVTSYVKNFGSEMFLFKFPFQPYPMCCTFLKRKVGKFAVEKSAPNNFPMLVTFRVRVFSSPWFIENILVIQGYTLSFSKNQINFAEVQCSYFWPTFSPTSCRQPNTNTPLKCIWGHVLSFRILPFYKSSIF